FCSFFRKELYFFLLALLAMHLQYIARFSQGEISHGSNFTGTALMTLALAAIFFKNEAKLQKFALGLLIFLIGIGYSSAAFAKLIGTGFTWVDGRHLYLWIGERSNEVLSQNSTFQLHFYH